MRYFEIVKPSARRIPTDTDAREAIEQERRSRKIETAGERCLSNLFNRINQPSRRRHLSPRRSQ